MSENRPRTDDPRAMGVGVAVAVLGYGLVALATGIDRSASLTTVMRPGAVGLFAGATVGGWVDGGSPRRGGDTGFRVVFVATTFAQGALFLRADAPWHFLLLGLMGAAVTYALPGALFGAIGGTLRRRFDREVGFDG